MVQTVSTDRIDHLVTGDAAPQEELHELGLRGVRLHIARLQD
jgi:hypothetical protein